MPVVFVELPHKKKRSLLIADFSFEVPSGIEPLYTVLQTVA